jgi:hypothetical protein
MKKIELKKVKEVGIVVRLTRLENSHYGNPNY